MDDVVVLTNIIHWKFTQMSISACKRFRPTNDDTLNAGRMTSWCQHTFRCVVFTFVHLLNIVDVHAIQFLHVITLANYATTVFLRRMHGFSRCSHSAHVRLCQDCIAPRRSWTWQGRRVRDGKRHETSTFGCIAPRTIQNADDDRLTTSGEIIERHFIQLTHCRCDNSYSKIDIYISCWFLFAIVLSCTQFAWQV